MLTEKTDGLTAANCLPPRSLGVVVLAGGRSSRMGVNKALLSIGNRNEETLLDRAWALSETVLRQCAQPLDQIYVSGEYQFYRSIEDRVEGYGPLGGLLSVMEYLISQPPPNLSYLLVLPVDMPALTAPLLVELVEISFRENRASCFKLSQLPFLIPVSVAVYEQLSQQLFGRGQFSSDHSVKSFLAKLEVLRVDTPVDRISEMTNVNTPEEFSSWQNGLGQASVKDRDC